MFSLVRKVVAAQSVPQRISARWISKSSEVNNSDTMTTGPTTAATSNKDHQQQGSKIKKNARTLATLQSSIPLATSTTMASKDKKREFMSFFPDIVREVTDKAKKYGNPTVAAHFAKVLQYNVPGGKKNRGLATVQAYEMLVGKEQLTEENVKLANYLGWCVEVMQACLVMFDDVMDGSKTRRGQPCWYMNEDIGLSAINDAMMVEHVVFVILKNHFSHLECYSRLMELFHEVYVATIVGQSLDMSKKQLSDFTMDLYKSIAQSKTAYYSFHLPVACAMLMAGYTDPESYRQARTILLQIGFFYQIQDDFLDCFGDPAVTGKVGTDIEEGKCTWLAVVFQQRATAAQKKLFAENYGKADAGAVRAVKDLYEEIGLPNTYAIYEEESYNMIKTHIQQTSRGVPHNLYFKLMDMIYRRDV